MTANLTYERFADIDLDDPFFESLKSDYQEFASWFGKKGQERAHTSRGEDGELDGFLYIKEENEVLNDLTPPLPTAHRMKIGTFKINPRGTRLGERFLKKTFDYAIEAKCEQIYVTVFPRYDALIQLFQRYGFLKVAEKTTENGTEIVLLRELFRPSGDVVKDYPLIPIRENRHFLLALYPEWHSRLLPDSILKTEDASILEDVSHTNSIHKIYLAAMRGVEGLRRGDTILIYRTKDGAGPAHYRSVATSLCVVEELRHVSHFPSFEEFQSYCAPYSIFTLEELRDLYQRRKYPWVIRFTYNLALRKRVTRQVLIEKVGLDPNAYWGFLPITSEQLRMILGLAGNDENPLIH